MEELVSTFGLLVKIKKLFLKLLPLLMKMRYFTLILLSLISSYFSLPNEFMLYGSPFLGIISYSLLFYTILNFRTTKQIYFYGSIYYIGLCLLTCYWLANFGGFAVWTVLGVALGHFLFYATTVFPVLSSFGKLNPRYIPILFAVTISLFDFIRSIGPIAFPWNLAAYPFNEVLPLIQIADIGGVFLVSFVVVYPQAIFAQWLFEKFPITPLVKDRRLHRFKISLNPFPAFRYSIHASILIFAVFIYGFIQLNQAKPESYTLKTILVQQNLDSFREGSFTNVVKNLISLSLKPTQGSVSFQDADLVMWSEGSLKLAYDKYKSWYEINPIEYPFSNFISQKQLLTGIPKIEGQNYYNSISLFTKDAEPLFSYAKRQLIPFAEYMPGLDIPFIRDFLVNTIHLPADGWKPGNSLKPIEFNFDKGIQTGETLRFAAPICFEDAVPMVTRDLVREGVHAIVNLTNNEWSKTKSAETQHFVAARFRSIENRIPAIRSTNAGITCVIDSQGRVLESLPMFEAMSMGISVEIPKVKASSFWMLYGEWIIVIFTLVFISGTVVSVFRAFKKP